MGNIIVGSVTANTGTAVDAAENGLSVINPAPGDYRAVLGNNVGGTAAQLTSDREIPQNGNDLFFSGAGEFVLGNTTNTGEKFTANGTVVAIDAVNGTYIILDPSDVSSRSQGRGITTADFNNNPTGIFFINSNFFPGLNPCIILTQTPVGGADCLVWQNRNPIGGLADSLGQFPSGNFFISLFNTVVERGQTLQVDGNSSIRDSLQIGFGSTGQQFYLILAAGGVDKVPFKYMAGVPFATIEPGGKYFDGNNELIDVGFTRYTIAKTLTTTANLDFPNTLTLTSSDLNIALVGVAVGDPVVVSPPPGSVLANSSYSAFVSAVDTVTVRFNNYSAGAQDPAAGVFRVSVIHY